MKEVKQTTTPMSKELANMLLQMKTAESESLAVAQLTETSQVLTP